jgi:hypothetical protein
MLREFVSGLHEPGPGLAKILALESIQLTPHFGVNDDWFVKIQSLAVHGEDPRELLRIAHFGIRFVFCAVATRAWAMTPLVVA